MRALSRQKRIAIELILARHGGKPSSARPSAAGSTSSDCAGLPGEVADKLTGPGEARPDHVVVITMWISHVAAATTWLGTTTAARCQADNVCHYRLHQGAILHSKMCPLNCGNILWSCCPGQCDEVEPFPRPSPGRFV